MEISNYDSTIDYKFVVQRIKYKNSKDFESISLNMVKYFYLKLMNHNTSTDSFETLNGVKTELVS